MRRPSEVRIAAAIDSDGIAVVLVAAPHKLIDSGGASGIDLRAINLFQGAGTGHILLRVVASDDCVVSSVYCNPTCCGVANAAPQINRIYNRRSPRVDLAHKTPGDAAAYRTAGNICCARRVGRDALDAVVTAAAKVGRVINYR